MMEKPKGTNKMAEVAADVPMPPVPGNLVPGGGFRLPKGGTFTTGT